MKRSGATNCVYALWHVHELPQQEDDAKLIGVYATRTDAGRAKRRAARLPGFKEHPAGFLVDTYEIGKDHWTEGFVTVTPGIKTKTTRTTATTLRRVPRRK
jgi:hypothetical protein